MVLVFGGVWSAVTRWITFSQLVGSREKLFKYSELLIQYFSSVEASAGNCEDTKDMEDEIFVLKDRSATEL